MKKDREPNYRIEWVLESDVNNIAYIEAQTYESGNNFYHIVAGLKELDQQGWKIKQLIHNDGRFGIHGIEEVFVLLEQKGSERLVNPAEL